MSENLQPASKQTPFLTEFDAIAQRIEYGEITQEEADALAEESLHRMQKQTVEDIRLKEDKNMNARKIITIAIVVAVFGLVIYLRLSN